MDYKQFNPGEVFTADDANNLLSGGMLVVDTLAELEAIRPLTARQQAIVLETGTRYMFIGSSLTWRPEEWTQSGRTLIVGSGTTYGATAVTFAVPFAAPPNIIVGSEHAGSTSNTYGMWGLALNITRTGFTVALKATANFSATYNIPWIASGY